MKLIVLFVLITIATAQICFNCASQCGPNGKCLGCDNGFFLDNTGACGRYTPIEDCKIYDIQTGGCLQCFPGSILQYGICQQLIQNCNQTKNNDTQLCTKCNDTFILVDDIHCYSSNIGSCPKGSLPRLLTSTNQGFCQKFELHKCLTPSQDISFCSQCYNGYYNINGVCNNMTSQTPCTGNSCNCQFYYKDDICYQFNIDGCISSKDKLYCDLCNDTLVAVSGRCFQPVKIADIHCNVLQLNSDICTGCNFNYLLDPNNICVKNIPLCSDPRRTCQVQCNHPSLLFYDGVCYLKDPQCIAYDINNYKCTKCFEGYFLNSNNKCQQKQKCWIFTSGSSNCQKCFTGFQLNPTTFTCDKLPYNCRVMNNIGVCQTCSSFTQLIIQQIPSTQIYPSNISLAVNTSICVYSTVNCQYYNIFGFCQICKANYIQKKHQCIPVATNCQIPLQTDKSKCQLCSVGYQLDAASSTCYPKVQGCLQYDSSRACTRCNQGFVLRNNICFYKDVNCLEYNSKGFCLRCGNSLVPYYNLCVFYDPYCYLYDRNGFCTGSFGGFSQSQKFDGNLQTNYRSFIAYVRNIQQSSSSASGSSGSSSGSSSSSSSGSGSSSSSSSSLNGQFSQISIFGGYFTSQGWIRVLPTIGLYNARIAQYDVNGRIRFCRDGYTLLNGNCVYRIDYCSEYASSNGLCVRCNPFYHLGPGRKCLSTSPSICSISTSTGQYCSKCAPDYTLINGQCYFSRLNVISYSSSNSSRIQNLENGYFVWSRYQIAYPYDQNCANQQQPGKCLQCIQQSQFTQSGIRNIDGRCILIKQNCIRYSVRGLCQACASNYFLYYGQCYPNNCLSLSPSGDACLTCPYLFTYQSGLCVNKIQSNCLVYDQIINFNPSITKSIGCRFCAQGFYLKNDSTCQRMISFCQKTDSQSGRCDQCISGYIKYDERCVKQISGCQIYNKADNYNTCSQCIQNYNLTNSICVTLPQRCIQLNQSTGYCSKCQTGYNPIIQNTQSICIFQVANCVTYDRGGRCVTCAKNFVLQKNLCNFFIQGCKDLVNGTCIRCITGYYLISGFCISDDKCRTVQAGLCRECIAGFRLVNGICVKNSIQNCRTQVNQDCLQCNSGFLRIVLNGRVLCVSRQIIYSGCSVQQYPCPKCEAGFQLRDDNLCYAKRCLFQLTQFSMRTCTACYPYYKLDPTSRFCILYNCNSLDCYDTNIIPPGFRPANRSGFIIQIQYCTLLQQDKSCRTCTNYRYPNLLVQWNLCHPSNCRSAQILNCSGNCINYFNNWLIDKSVCVADNCQIYNNDGTCSVCIKPYNLTNGICLYNGPCLDYNPTTAQCKNCRDSYSLLSGSCIPKNCTSYSPTDVSVCLQCARGFQLTPNKTCQLKYCSYPYQNYPCLACITGYYFNPLTLLCHMNNCLIFDYSNGKCQQCQPQYTISNDYCVPDKCVNFNTNSWKCLSCLQGYKLNQNGLCVIDNCCSFNGNVCIQCCSGYDYVLGQCRSRCTQRNQQGICLSCLSGYKLNSNNECVTQIKGCITYNGNQCTQCQVGLTLVNNRCVPKYCVSYSDSDNTYCNQCHPRFYSLNSGLCYPKNCILFNTTEWACQQCQYGPNYRFSLIPNTSICFTDRCSSYQLSDYVCKSCQNGLSFQYTLQTLNSSEVCILQCNLYYQLSNGQCKLKYCSSYSPNGQCLTCALGYELQASTGYCRLKYCLNYNQQNCIQCQNGFIFDPINKKYCVPNNCENYNIGSQTCQKCLDGYVRQYNLCVLRDCFNYNNQYICQRCLDGFTLTQVNGILVCQKQFNSTCSEGYYFSTARGLCQPIPVEFCRYVNPANPSVCLSCFPNYLLYQGLCYSIDGCQPFMYSYIFGCKACIQGFKLQGNLCVKDLCNQYFTDSKTCKTCVNGYFLVNGNCVSYTNFCINGNVYQGCTNCQTGYQNLNGICRKLPDNCAVINPALDCIQCASGFILFNGICFKTIQNCISQRGPFCEKCDAVYVLSDNQLTCISKQPIKYCDQHDSTFDNCLVCQRGYKLTPDRKCLAQNCTKYDLKTYICTECGNYTIGGVSYFYVLRDEKCISISIGFCTIPLNQTNCRVCNDGFILDNGLCKANNCQFYRSNQQQCSTCLPRFYLTQNNVCQKYPDNCQVVNLVGSCTVCIAGFTLNSAGVCVKGTDFCSQYNNDGVCIKCQQLYYLNAARACLKLPDNCANANLFGQCLECVNPFVLSGSGVCYRLIQNCSKYSDQGDCTSCNNGYYLNQNSVCQILPDNCLFATSTGICRQCLPTYRLQGGLCIKSIQNCAQYQGSACVTCNTKYYLINGLCYKLPDRCVIVNQRSQCLRCEFGYTLYQGFCYLNIPNCLAYNSLGNCVQCSDGYYVNSAGRCSNIPNGCNKVNLNGICLECLKGFALSNGICYLQVSNCFTYNPATNLCQQCTSGYYLIEGKCYKLPDNCRIINIQSICLNCSFGYILQNGICYRNIPNCDFYSSNGICNKCANGYYLAANGLCTSLPQGCSQLMSNTNLGCASCITGYVLQGGICYKQYPNCFLYDQSTKLCRQCVQNYFPLNGFCYLLPSNCTSINLQLQCAQCATGFILQSGNCYRKIPNCVTYSDSNCIKCIRGYYVKSGSCVQSPANCADFSAANGICLRCIEGFLLQNGVCYLFDKNCASYDPSTFLCKTCVTGYYLNYQYTCQLTPINCLSVNIYGNCTGCRQNFTLTNGLCYPPIPQCDNWNLTTMLCAKCIREFFLRDGYCYRTVENCAIYSPTNFVCIKCIDNYMLTNNICITCSDGYYVDNYGQCRPNPPNCKVSNQFGQCLFCLTGYTILNNVCSQQITYCQNYSQNSQGRNVCTQCYIGYYMKDPFTCLRLPNGCASANSSGFCLQCFEGYAVNANGICYTIIAYCQTYQLSTGLCMQCIPNYYININQTCTPMLENNCLFANSLGQCIQCVQGYVLVSSICYPAIPYCFNHSTSSYVCLQCFQGYYLFNRTCFKIPNGCSNVVNNICTSCTQGYQLNNGLCQLVDNTTCIRYQLLSNICLECKAGFYLSTNNYCMKIPDYCAQANSQGQCLNCISSYILNNGICYKQIPNCLRLSAGTCAQCIDQYYLQNGLCYKFPDYCQTFDTFSLSCLKCITGYQLSFGRCIINLTTNCLYYNPLSTNQCYTCRNTFYQLWINPNTGDVNTAIMTVDNFCRPYPQFCTNVDLLGNCISCCFASQLQNGRCVGTIQRSLNCDIFDSVNLKCLKCMIGYVYCDWLAICIQVNLNCQSYNSMQQCTKCVQGFILINGDCVKSAPGVSSSNSGICLNGYTYSTVTQYGNSAGSCFRNKNQLRKLSQFAQYDFTSYRPGASAFTSSQRLTSLVYTPPSFLNNYFAYKTSKPQIIHYIQLQGSSNGYVTHYLIQYRNKDNAPFICWNSCQKVRGNANGNDVAQLKLIHPIVATQIRIYPLKWVNSIWMSVQMLVEKQ